MARTPQKPPVSAARRAELLARFGGKQARPFTAASKPVRKVRRPGKGKSK